MIKLTPAFLSAMLPGATFETEGAMPGLSAAPLAWKNTSLNHGSGQYMFSLSYFGVALGQVAVFVRGGDRLEAERM